VRDLVSEFYSDRGKPSVDPVVIFKMSLLGYFYGISSEKAAG
jgi:transposase